MNLSVNVLRDAIDNSYIDKRFKAIVSSENVKKRILIVMDNEVANFRSQVLASWFGAKTESSVATMSMNLIRSVKTLPSTIESSEGYVKVIGGIQYGTGVAYADTHIGEENSVKEIYNRGKLLAVPKKGGPADNGNWFSIFKIYVINQSTFSHLFNFAAVL